jgi:hypothetical protein
MGEHGPGLRRTSGVRLDGNVGGRWYQTWENTFLSGDCEGFWWPRQFCWRGVSWRVAVKDARQLVEHNVVLQVVEQERARTVPLREPKAKLSFSSCKFHRRVQLS